MTEINRNNGLRFDRVAASMMSSFFDSQCNFVYTSALFGAAEFRIHEQRREGERRRDGERERELRSVSREGERGR